MSGLNDRAVDRLRGALATPGEGDLLEGRFDVLAPLSEATVGLVHAGWDRGSHRNVAIRFVSLDDADAAERFERDVVELKRIEHPALVRHRGHGVHGLTRYVVMDRLEGSSLAERLVHTHVTVPETAALGLRIAGALGIIHAASLVHHDVKPSNIVLVGGRFEGACLIDFGFEMTAPGLRNNASADDVLALGRVLFECLAGRPAPGAETPPALRTLPLDVPEPLASLVRRMLDPIAPLRPTATRVESELSALASTVGSPARARSEPPRVSEVESEPSDAPRPGTLFATKYLVESRIGEGGMGVVLRAKHVQLGKRVALKLLRAPYDAADEARFLREAQAASRLESEHVARVLDVGRGDEGPPYMVMEFLSGVDLARELQLKGRLPAKDAVGYVLQACEAIAEAHALGIVHRDLKPSNLFLTTRRDGTSSIKVLDFGISKVTRAFEGDSIEHMSMTGPATVMGSMFYVSPEQLRSSKLVDARTDIWSLGVLLYELLSGVLPFRGDAAVAVIASIAVGEETPLRTLVPESPASLERAIARCLKKAPEARFTDVGELAEALVPFAGNAGAASVERIKRVLGTQHRNRVDSVGSPPVKHSARKVLILVGIGGILAGAGAAVTCASTWTKPIPHASPTSTASAESSANAETQSEADVARPAEEGSMTLATPPAESSAIPLPSLRAKTVPSAAPLEKKRGRPAHATTSSAEPPPPSLRPSPAPEPTAHQPTAKPRRDVDLRDPALETR